MSAARPPEPVLVDTSVAVALVVADHEHHGATVAAVGGRTVGLSGHAGFETFSVLSRLPPPLRRTPEAIARLLADNFPTTEYLSAEGQRALHDRLAALDITGGSVYDALVGAAAAEHGMTLLTRDRRAVPIYLAVGTTLEVV